jgi:hypothetical protein
MDAGDAATRSITINEVGEAPTRRGAAASKISGAYRRGLRGRRRRFVRVTQSALSENRRQKCGTVTPRRPFQTGS